MDDLIKMPSKIERVRLLQPFGGNVAFASGQSAVVGSLFITPTHVMFYADRTQAEIWVATQLIESAERGPLTAAGCTLTIKCKHFMHMCLVIAKDAQCQEACDTLKLITAPMNLQDVYAFKYESAEMAAVGVGRAFAWDMFDMRREYDYMRLDSDKWTVTDFNANYEQCETYPEWLAVPSAAHKSVLLGSCKFRSRGRLPVLTYYYAENHAAICRCSQPLAGFSARCMEDEKMMQHILQANPTCNVLYMIDTRPKLNAITNKAMGKGFEDERNYANMRLHTFDIANIHVMRGSLRKLVDGLHRPQATVNAVYAAVEHSGWLRHIRLILECGRFVADSVRSGISCVVHCSDGWDRTAQVVALAQILLEPRYRTIDGFRALIEKDWLAFGHKYTDRCAHIRPGRGGAAWENGGGPNGAEADAADCAKGDARETSPVFTQFLDAVAQLAGQFPAAFEFDERLLVDVNDQAHACQYGTFLGNCDKDRKDLRLRERTYSYWASVHCRRAEFTNTLYDPAGDRPAFLKPDVRIQAIRLWRGLYCRFIPVGAAEPLRLAADTANRRCRVLGRMLASAAEATEGVAKLNVDESDHAAADSRAEIVQGESAASGKCVKWQSLRCRSCSICHSTFPIGDDSKVHCGTCGSLVCRRCMATVALGESVDAAERPAIGRICVKCSKTR